MAFLLALVIALAPLAMAPGIMFYFDVTPKTAVLLAGAAVALPWFASRGAAQLWRRREGRWFCLLLFGSLVSLAVSTLASARPALSLAGSAWRRYGLITQAALLALALIL